MEGVAAAANLVVLLQNEYALAGLGQQRSHRQPANAASNHNGVEVLRNLAGRVAVLQHLVSGLGGVEPV